MSKKFYCTTPIYYVNDIPHIGHAYTTVAADTLARYKRLTGHDVLFVTGTDEHGQKVENAALAKNITPKELADSVVSRYENLWKVLDISYDDFIRTTEERHKKRVHWLWKKVLEKNDIYLGEYEDWYCTPCETFLTEKQLIDNKCPDCKRDVEKLKEKSYFFRLSDYTEKLIKHIEDNVDFIQPKSKRNEVLSFLKEGLRDLSISRTTFSWGIPVPEDMEHVIYVWFDALINYLSASGYPDNKKFWPPDVHIIGKDILRFHAVFWPAFLMSGELELPKKVFAHGWWTIEGEKMSKSKGNVVDPFEICETFGADMFRYFLLREVPFGGDGDFSRDSLKLRINTELANDLGNLLSRSVALFVKYFDGEIKAPKKELFDDAIEGVVLNKLDALFAKVDKHMDSLSFSLALQDIWEVIRDMNAYIDKREPWKEENKDLVLNSLFVVAEGLRIVSMYTFPFMPNLSQEIWNRLAIKDKIEDKNLETDAKFGDSLVGNVVEKGKPLIPRLD